MNNIQKNFKAKSALRHCADGGRVSGPGGPVDDKVGPVMLSDKEYVLPADTVDAVGVGQLDALRAATHTPAGLRRTGNNPERAAMMQEQYAQPVTAGAPKQFTQLPLPEVAPKADTRPEKAFMYRDNLGDSLRSLRDKIPGLANGGMLREDLYLKTAGPNGLRTPPPTAPSLAPSANQLPAVRGPSTMIPNGPAPAASGGAPPIRDIPGEVVGKTGQARLPAPEAPAAAPKSSGLSKALKYGGGAVGMVLAGKDIYDSGLNWDNGTDMALSAGMMAPNKVVSGLSTAGVVGKAVWDMAPDSVKTGVADALTPAAKPAAAVAPTQDPISEYAQDKLGKEPGDTYSPEELAALGLGTAAKGMEAAPAKDGLLPDLNIMGPARDAQKLREMRTAFPNGPLAEPKPVGGGAYDAMSDRIAKDAISRPAAGAPAGAPAPADAGGAGLGKTAIATTTDYQRDTLTGLGVPESVQTGPALEQGARTLATAGKGDQFQNLGAYGGDANLYGRASDPARPGRINDFVGVGAKATPESALRGGTNTIPGNDWQVQRGRELLAQDAAQRTAGGRDPNKLYIGTADGELGSTEQRFGAMRREIQQKFGGAGQEAQLARHLQDLNENQSVAMAADAATAQRGEEARLKDATDRYVSDNTRESYKYTADATHDAAMGSNLRAAMKDAAAGQLANDKMYTDNVKAVAEIFAAGDKDKAALYHTVLSRLPQEMQTQLSGMSGPEQQEAMASALGSATAGRNMEEGRDTGATTQNALLGALATGLPAAIAAVKAGKGKAIPTLVGLAGAAGGAYFTPKNKPSELYSPLRLDPNTGLPIVASPSTTDALKYGAFDTLTSKNYIDASGNLVDSSKLTADQLSAMIAQGKITPTSK